VDIKAGVYIFDFTKALPKMTERKKEEERRRKKKKEKKRKMEKNRINRTILFPLPASGSPI
jgi:hypothetical protein